MQYWCTLPKIQPNVWFDRPKTQHNFQFGSAVCGSATFIQHCIRPIYVYRGLRAWMSTPSLPKLAKLQVCRSFRNPVVEASLVCSLKFSSTSCQTAPRARTAEAQAQALSWMQPCRAQESGQHPGLGLHPTSETERFSFWICLFGERRKVRQTRNGRGRGREMRLLTANPESLLTLLFYS